MKDYTCRVCDGMPTGADVDYCARCTTFDDDEEAHQRRMIAGAAYICSQCEGTDVHHAMWCSLNSSDILDPYGTWCTMDNSWCNTCSEHVHIRLRSKVELP